MSIITVQVGQCGNQIGRTLFDQLVENIESADRCSPYARQKVVSTFFDHDDGEKLKAKAILLDMEPKVVQKCLSSRGESTGHQWMYNDSMAYFKQGGSGNNWALGHKYLTDEVYDAVSGKLQSMLERQDYFQGFHVLKSLAGGTGSGLGAHLIERMRDDHPKSMILNTAVWPYSQGEVILQNYNILLTLASSLESASAILPIYNDEALATCRHLLK